jgi:hypothetical protein
MKILKIKDNFYKLEKKFKDEENIKGLLKQIDQYRQQTSDATNPME